MNGQIACDAPGHSFKTVQFSERIDRMCEKAGGSSAYLRPVTVHEALAGVEAAQAFIADLADAAIIERLLAHNSAIIQKIAGVKEAGGKAGSVSPAFIAYLPLNDVGHEAITHGRFDWTDPVLPHICRAGERPRSIYIWLLFAPRAFAPAMRALAGYLEGIAPGGCPLFARAANTQANRLIGATGFTSARTIFPAASKTLLVALPRGEFIDGDEPVQPSIQPSAQVEAPATVSTPAPAARNSTITIRTARTLEDIMKVFSIRAATYIHEQLCPYDEEFDGNDFCSTHLLAEIGGEPVGCLRIRYFADFVKIERLAVRREYRASRAAFRLVRHGLDHCRRKGYRRAYGHAREDLTGFWGMFGFAQMDGRPAFEFSGVRYCEMEAALPQIEDRIEMDANPFLLIRPEGSWDMPGPLDPGIATRMTRIRLPNTLSDKTAATKRRKGGRHEARMIAS